MQRILHNRTALEPYPLPILWARDGHHSEFKGAEVKHFAKCLTLYLSDAI